MTSNLATMLSLLGYDDRTIIRTIALWRVREPNLDTIAAPPGGVLFLVRAFGVCP